MESKFKWILIAILIGTFMTALDATIVSVALPEMAKTMGENGHDTSNISWVLLIYTLMLSCFILLWSKVGTNIGYKKVFMMGIAIFAITSLLIGICGLNPSIGLTAIIILRAIQGLGAGMSMAVSLAMVGAYLPVENRGSSIAGVTLAASVGTAFGPALGGLLAAIHWSYIFFINVPIGAICLILCWKFMRVEEELPTPRPKIDVLGAIFMFIAMFAFIFYLNRGSDVGWISEKGVFLIVVMCIGAGLLVWWEGRSADPLIKKRLIKESNITKSNLATAIMMGAMAGCYLLLPYYLGAGANSTDDVKILGALSYSTIEYGCILIASSVGMMISGLIVGKITDRTGGCKQFMIIGALATAAGFIMMMFFTGETQLWYILISLFVMGFGMGMAMVGATNLAFKYILPGEDGQLSGLTNTFRQAGSSAGVAIIEAIFTAGIVVAAGTVDLGAGLKHAFFIAVILALLSFVVAMSCKDKPKDADAAVEESAAKE